MFYVCTFSFVMVFGKSHRQSLYQWPISPHNQPAKANMSVCLDARKTFNCSLPSAPLFHGLLITGFIIVVKWHCTVFMGTAFSKQHSKQRPGFSVALTARIGRPTVPTHLPYKEALCLVLFIEVEKV